MPNVHDVPPWTLPLSTPDARYMKPMLAVVIMREDGDGGFSAWCSFCGWELLHPDTRPSHHLHSPAGSNLTQKTVMGCCSLFVATAHDKRFGALEAAKVIAADLWPELPFVDTTLAPVWASPVPPETQR